MDVIYNAQNEYKHRSDGIVLNVKYRRPPLSSDVQRARRGHEAAVSIAGEVSVWSRPGLAAPVPVSRLTAPAAPVVRSHWAEQGPLEHGGFPTTTTTIISLPAFHHQQPRPRTLPCPGPGSHHTAMMVRL